MQAPTHLLVGIVIQKIFYSHTNLNPFAAAVITLALAFLSHFVVDLFSIFTYHPPKADWHDKFWVTYHMSIYALTIVIFVLFAQFWLGLIGSVLVDIIDWLLLRAILKKEPVIHPVIKKIQTFAFGKPKHIYDKWTVIFEGLTIALLWYSIFLL